MDFLKSILGEELFTTFSEKVKSHNEANPDKAIKLADLSSGAYVSKQKYDDAITESNGYKGLLATRDKDIDELKKKATSADDLTSQLNALQEKYNKDTADLEGKLTKSKADSAFEIALAKSGAKNTKALRGLFDMDKIKFENDELTGFSEQLEQIKAENDYLFESAKPGASGMRHDGSGGSDDPFVISARSAAGLKN